MNAGLNFSMDEVPLALRQSQLYMHAKSKGLYSLIYDNVWPMGAVEWMGYEGPIAPAFERCRVEANLELVNLVGTFDRARPIIFVPPSPVLNQQYVAYQCLFDGCVWLRPASDFFDGRFVSLSVEMVSHVLMEGTI